ncbi:glycosyltransferase [Brucella sp. NBRC 12950]|uniref:glycosyltransferase n=1 Tax=Brucella sp. NBRC 12950 TaxID=2994518 RepID=UPI002553857F|nr:glycosyltransferase [Brucella sp. NBRC 12950]
MTVITNASCVEPGFQVALKGNELSDRFTSFGDRFHLIDIGSEKFPSYIPYVQPMMSSLLGAILTKVDDNPPDVIVGSYLEPYGMAALCAASFHSIPTYIRHAGSDVGALAIHPLLKTAYSHALIQADGILSHNSVENRKFLKALNVKDQYVKDIISVSNFAPFLSNKCLDIESYAEIAQNHYAPPYLSNIAFDCLKSINSSKWGSSAPTIGIYGKTGRFKGTFQLIEALQQFATEATPFRFLIALAGWKESVAKVIQAIYNSNLRMRARILPPLPLWRVPEFLSCCDVVAFLENNFPIASHTPRVPLEIISSAKTLLVTREQIERICLDNILIHNDNALIVEPPYNAAAIYEALSSSLQNPAKMSAVSSRASIVRKLLGLKSDCKLSFANDMLATLEKEMRASSSREPPIPAN